MARSRRRTPIIGNCCCRSERPYKQLWHRRFRRAAKQAIHHAREVMPHTRELSDPWAMGKDGKTYWGWTPHWTSLPDWQLFGK